MSWEHLVIIPILSLLMLAHEFGHFFVARRVGVVVQEFGFGLPPRLVGVRWRGVVYSLNAIPFGAFVRMIGEEDPSEPGSFARQSRLARAAILVAGPAMNLLLAVAFFALTYMVGWPTPTRTHVEVLEVAAGSPAATSGLQPGDVIVAVQGQPLARLDDFQQRTRQRLGEPVELLVERGGERLTVTVVPRADPPEGEGPMGVRVQGRVLEVRPQPYPALPSLWYGFLRTVQVVEMTLLAPVLLLQGVVPAEVLRPVGPVGIAQVATQAAEFVAETGWWYPLLTVTATVSAGLAVANLLPLPALDGGRLLFVLIEAVRRRRVAPETEGAFHFVGIVVLITLMLLISYYDVVSPVGPVEWAP